jgi:hypothetical protein
MFTFSYFLVQDYHIQVIDHVHVFDHAQVIGQMFDLAQTVQNHYCN